LGASLVTISPQLPQFCNDLVKERKLPFEVLSDKEHAVAKKFGVAFTMPEKMQWVYRDVFKVDLPAFNGDTSWMLPMPARFVIDQNSAIHSTEVSLDHTSRPQPAVMIEELKKLLRV
jgi:peroxiredoxin